MKDEAAIMQSTSGEPMALAGVTAKGRVRGLLFELTVEQRYRNEQKRNVEAVYTFPLPFDAVLLDLDITIGERRLSAVVVERRQAEADYEEAIGKGDTAIMLERAGDGLCTLNLGNLMAGEEATVRYRYATLLRFEHGSVRIAVPTVIAPRYGDPKAAKLEAHQVPTSDLAAEYPFSLTVDLHGDVASGSIASPSHAITTTPREDGVGVTLAQTAFLDRDFVLVIDGLAGRSLATLARDGERFVALASFCADVPRSAADAPLTLKLLVDCSGSMAGDSIAAAKRALHEILSGLGSSDRYSLSRFGSSVIHETRGLVPATPDEVRRGARIVGSVDANLGGTEMTSALESVFALGGAAADVLVITDGEVWDAGSLADAARAAKQRVFAVGIGAAPAEGVLRRLAETTGGACEFVAPNEDATAGILRMFARLRAPRVTRTSIDWPTMPEWVTPLPGGLFGGETVHVFAGFPGVPAGTATLAMFGANGERLTATAHIPVEAIDDGALAPVAAFRRLGTVDAEAQLRLALDYGLLTERTNLLVVHERADGEKAIDLPKLAHVPQMLAAGWGGMGTLKCLAENDTAYPRRPYAAKFELDFAASGDCELGKLDVPPASSTDDDSGFERLVQALESFADDPGKSLPTTLDALRRLGLPVELNESLRELVARGANEADVVRALLAALLEQELNAPLLSRRLKRRLTRIFASDDECRELREEVRRCLQGAAVQRTG